MKTKKAADIVLTVFLIFMVMLTVFAKDLYRMTLPKVVTEEVVRKAFPYEVTGPDGEVYLTKRMAYAVPKEALRGNVVFTVNETEKGLFLMECVIGTGEEQDGFVEVTEGLSGRVQVVMGSDREVHEGQQVLLTEQKEWVELHMARERGGDMVSYATNMRKRLKVDILCVVGAALMTIGAVLLCRRFCKGHFRFLKVSVLILWCVLLCLFFKATILLPGEWIPGKLIDWDGWKVNMERFPF